MQLTVNDREEELKVDREKMEQMEALLEQMHILNKVVVVTRVNMGRRGRFFCAFLGRLYDVA